VLVTKPGIGAVYGNRGGGRRKRELIQFVKRFEKKKTKDPSTFYLLPRVVSSLETARFMAPNEASQARSRVSQVSASNTPSAQTSFQKAVNWVVYCIKWGIEYLVCWIRMWAKVEERAFGATFAREAKVDGEICNRLLRSKSWRFVRRKFCRRGNKVGDDTVRGKMGSEVELGALAGKVGSAVQYAAIKSACVGYSKGASVDDFEDDNARMCVGSRLFCDAGGMFTLTRCEDGTDRGSMGIILLTAEHIVSPMSIKPRRIYSIGTFASSGSTAAMASGDGFLN